jgi:predicted transcriptional regulator
MICNRLPLDTFLSITSFQIQVIKPTVLIGSSGVGKTFTKEVVEAMTANNKVKSYLTLSCYVYLYKKVQIKS